MKKYRLQAMAAVLLGTVLTGCGVQKEAEQKEENGQKPKEVIVFAAASMTETLTELEKIYENANRENPVDLIFNFDSSGTLKTQIAEGAPCDIFISAGEKQIDALDKQADTQKNPEGLDFLVEGTRRDFLENEVVLCTAEGNPGDIAGFDDLMEKLPQQELLLAVGNSDVPVGQYTEKIFAYYDVSQEELAKDGKITYGTNVKEITTQVAEGSVDAGIIYRTDAYSAGLEVKDRASEEMCGRVLYPAAVINTGKETEEAKKFLEFLEGEEAEKIFTKVGFRTVNEKKE